MLLSSDRNSFSRLFLFTTVLNRQVLLGSINIIVVFFAADSIPGSFILLWLKIKLRLEKRLGYAC